MIQIDIDADLNMVDDDDRNMAPLPRHLADLKPGQVLIAGRPGFWSWVQIDEATATSVFFHQISAREARLRGDLSFPAPN